MVSNPSFDPSLFNSGVSQAQWVEWTKDRRTPLINKATACMDISDGLSLDLHRLTKASGVGAVLDRGLPVLEGATLDQALHDGEDYELLYTAPPRVRVPGHRIGTIVTDRPGRVTFMGLPLKPQGYDHFRR